jgi:hypothetical protein
MVSSKSDTGSGDASRFICRPSRVTVLPPGPHRTIAGLGIIEVIAIPSESRHDCPVATRRYLRQKIPEIVAEMVVSQGVV